MAAETCEVCGRVKDWEWDDKMLCGFRTDGDCYQVGLSRAQAALTEALDALAVCVGWIDRPGLDANTRDALLDARAVLKKNGRGA